MEEKIKIVFDWKNISTVLLATLGFIAVLILLSFVVGKIPNNNSELADSQLSSEDISMEGLEIQDLKVGEGDEVKDGDLVSVNYRGTLTSGKEFDNSYDRGEPFEFTVGVGEVIKGWDEGLKGMKVGGKRKLTIPPQLGYGEQGAGDDIPPNSTLVFEIELLEIK